MYKVTPKNDVQALLLKSFEINEDYDFWSELRRPGHDTSIMVAPNAQESFKGFLDDNGIPYETVIENVET